MQTTSEAAKLLGMTQRNLGLSLSDHYWIRPADFRRLWDDINFFNNYTTQFKLVSQLFAVDGKAVAAKSDNTADGNLQKFWLCVRKGLFIYGKSPHVASQSND